jgi:D-proline reductase (dithiol) PrdB
VGDLSEFSFPIRTFLKAYRWRRIDPVPWSPLRKPLSEANVALVTTAGLVLPQQAPFDEHVKGGDASYRVIPADADVRTLIDTHRSDTFDHSGVAADANLVFPLDRLHELAREGVVGRVNRRHLSFMGSITATARLAKERAPEAARLLAEDAVDAALLVPV